MAGMMRALEAFQEAIIMVDASAQPWKVLYVNSAFLDRIGALRLPLAVAFAGFCPMNNSEYRTYKSTVDGSSTLDNLEGIHIIPPLQLQRLHNPAYQRDRVFCCKLNVLVRPA